MTCRVLKIARQPYYRWLAQPVGEAEWDEAHLANALFDAHRDDPEFGYRFLADEVADAGFGVCERTVWKICSQNGWWSSLGKKRPKGKRTKVQSPAHDDLVRRDFHTDRGSQFRARKVHRALTHHRMVGSMGQVGSAGDNAAMESFFALLQKNVLGTRSWETREELRIAIVTWIERTYHRRRRQDALGRLTPVEYEVIMTPRTATAA